MSSSAYRSSIRDLVEGIHPFDALESSHQREVLGWIDSRNELCRQKKPATPPKHLVSYALLMDPERGEILLADHRKSQLWLPPGGHVDPREHPEDTAIRELREELGVEPPLLRPGPLFLTVTETVGDVERHVDVSLWYLFAGSLLEAYSYDDREFFSVRWFPLEELPLERAEPHLRRFCDKINTIFTMESVSWNPG